MPIPMLLTSEDAPLPSPQKQEFSLQIVASSPARWEAAPLLPRAAAYGFDLLLVYGASSFVAKFFSLFLVSFHMHAIQAAGRNAAGLVREMYAYGDVQLMSATFFLAAYAYFVILPHFTGRTLGLGMFGMKIVGPFGERPSTRGLLYRQVGSVAHCMTMGTMFLQLLKGEPRPLFQDAISKTRVVKVL